MKKSNIIGLVISCFVVSCHSPKMGGRILRKYYSPSYTMEIWDNGFKSIEKIPESFNIVVEYKGDSMSIPVDETTYKSLNINDYYQLDRSVK